MNTGVKKNCEGKGGYLSRNTDFKYEINVDINDKNAANEEFLKELKEANSSLESIMKKDNEGRFYFENNNTRYHSKIVFSTNQYINLELNENGKIEAYLKKSIKNRNLRKEEIEFINNFQN